ncbi:anthranilate synthase component I family protein [Microbacterium betulae]|uniref:Anthranilate synthase component I family protein n=1 Tax=Microbacterium betulae TaxID=2981139 RepID=A0AA97I4I5_9MICO|nr:anthranilate synthase component I family protein [Microbacterium sp. AB]WOF21794.1 anthranilate synthase component I family protein [Microbacterium sp. AB]
MIADERPGTWLVWTEEHPLEAEPDALFAHLYGADGAPAVWLDSASQAYGSGRYSLMGAPEGPRDHVLAFWAADGRLAVDGQPAGTGHDLWRLVGERLDRNPSEAPAGLPFAGGYVGAVGYGVKSVGARPRSDAPDAQLAHLSRFLVLDHLVSRLHVVATGPASDEAEARAWIERTVDRIAHVRPLPRPAAPVRAGAAATSVTRDRYLDDLAAVRAWLRAGDSYEACYTYSLRFASDEAPFDVYRRLRRTNPAPYASYLRLDGRDVLSCSPERYLAVTSSGWAETKPIKGTARREADPASDREAARALAADPKTRSENLMIVDLLRNDLGRVCAPGTVTVPRLMAVESYATVHQLVTSVRGRLLPRRAAAVHAAEALFPPGSMTGAPKRRTVELLDGLEAAARGLYSGVIGAFSRCGAVDLAVVIRTAVVSDGLVEIGTGGAITIESDPESEADETVAKATPLLQAFGRTHPFEARRGRAGA